MNPLKWLLGGVVAVLVPVTIAVVSNRPKEPNSPAKPVSARQKIEVHLDRVDQASAAIADKHIERIRSFLRERKAGIKDFGQWPYSWTGKWYALKGKVQGDDSAGFKQFLEEKFAQHVFRSEELQAVLESALAGFSTETQGLQNDMLVQLRADLADGELFGGNLPELQSDQAFQQEFERLAEQVLPKVIEDMKLFAAGQLTSFVGSEIITASLGSSLAARLGLSGGVLGTAARWGVVTLGVGLVSWLILDYVWDWVMQLAGHKPAGELADKVGQALDRVEARLIEGDPAAVAEHQRLRQQERDDPSPEVQGRYREEAVRIEQTGALGVRWQLQNLLELQARLRREALLKLALAQSGQ